MVKVNTYKGNGFSLLTGMWYLLESCKNNSKATGPMCTSIFPYQVFLKTTEKDKCVVSFSSRWNVGKCDKFLNRTCQIVNFSTSGS